MHRGEHLLLEVIKTKRMAAWEENARLVFETHRTELISVPKRQLESAGVVIFCAHFAEFSSAASHARLELRNRVLMQHRCSCQLCDRAAALFKHMTDEQLVHGLRVHLGVRNGQVPSHVEEILLHDGYGNGSCRIK